MLTTMSLRRDLDDNNEPSMLYFLFTCKDFPDSHPVHQHPCMQSGQGTKNLQEGFRVCQNRSGDGTGNAACKVPTVKYTPANHQTLIAMRCAKSHRPMNSVADEDYQTEVEMLRPGTVLPHPSTVSRDIKSIYLTWSILVRTYFAVCIGHYIMYPLIG
jgi:hypothetical protein